MPRTTPCAPRSQFQPFHQSPSEKTTPHLGHSASCLAVTLVAVALLISCCLTQSIRRDLHSFRLSLPIRSHSSSSTSPSLTPCSPFSSQPYIIQCNAVYPFLLLMHSYVITFIPLLTLSRRVSYLLVSLNPSITFPTRLLHLLTLSTSLPASIPLTLPFINC